MSRDRLSEPVFLGTPGYDRLALRVLRYQFPGHASSTGGKLDTDSNWLMIEGWVERGDDRWDFVDPCLLTTELAELIAWLRALPNSPAPLGFIEPLLRFMPAGRDDQWTVFVQLRAEAVPERVCGEDRWHEGVMLVLMTSPEQRDRVVQQLEADLARFPVR